MGTVYLATHPRLPRQDAVKILSDERQRDQAFRALFLREAELVARLQHPNLVAVRDRGEDNGRLWIAMQYVDGVDLGVLIRQGPTVLPPDRVVHIVTEAACGLDAVHAAGMLHRDVKPTNILISTRPGEPDRALITDFGVARSISDTTTVHGDGGMRGTVAYAAPESIRGESVDHRADVYALGCTLFHALTGSAPFVRDSAGAVMHAHLYEPPPRPSERNPLVPRAFDAVIATALAKKPGDRYVGCGELAAAARAALTDTGVRPSTVRKLLGRRLVRLGLGVALVLALVVGVTVFAVTGRGRPEASAVHTRPPVTGTTMSAEWGGYAFVVQAFPDLLPPTPGDGGYRNVTSCTAYDAKAGEVVSFDNQGQVAQLNCLGDLDPVYGVTATCNRDRSPMKVGVSLGNPEGDQDWSRGSSSGHLFWGKAVFPAFGSFVDGKAVGFLDVYFNDASRNFCMLTVSGLDVSGTQLRDTWWADAPL
ncbi:hypothetical protein GCM10027167_46780 [Nocardia heshunensis]